MATFELPEEIVRDILSRLPVKSLLRFRSVCKSWCSLFKNPDFIAENHNYATLNSPHNVLVLKEEGKDLRFSVVSDCNGDGYEIVTVFTPFFFEYLVIKGSVNGLICLHNKLFDEISLWNPATREFKTIPSPQFKPLHGSINLKTSNLAFGFDKKTNDYKILRFVYNRLKQQIQLYSLKNDSWKEMSSIAEQVVTNNEISFNPYINGVCYWWGMGGGDNKPFVLSFDFANEVFEKLLLPTSCYSLIDMYYCCELAIINGMLSVVSYIHSRDEEEAWFDICAMTRHGVEDSWTEVVSPFSFNGCVKLIGIWKNYLLLQDNSNYEQLVLCHHRTQQVYNFQLDGSIQVSYYVESLVPINGRHWRSSS